MSGRVVHGREARGDVSLSADVVVVGSGAGGSMAARELARGGRDVVLLEEGGDHLPEHFTQREDEMVPELFQELGGRRTDDHAILILSGRGLGGSTVHNTNVCKRTAPEILSQWRDDLRLEGVSPEAMAPFFEEVERDLGVVPIDPLRLSSTNRVVQRGVERLGWRGAMLSHNRDDKCIGSGFCELGCAYDGKLNARRVLVPEAIDKGAIVYTDARVTRVTIEGGRASGVVGEITDGRGRRRASLSVRARVVCLAGSAVGSAAIALRSGIPDPHAQLGRHLRIHPSAVVAGRFDERIEGWRGIPQSFDCTEHLDLRKGSDKRVWILPSFAHPVGSAALSPGFGPKLMRSMRAYPHLVPLAAVVHDESEGEVYVDGERTRIRYAPNAADREQLALGAREAARLLLAAGAREVMVPAAPEVSVRRESDLKHLTSTRFLPHDAKIMAVHPMGTLRMAKRPEEGAVDARGKMFGVDGIFVVDGSLFPTSIGGPPQMSIFAFGMKVARGIVRG